MAVHEIWHEGVLLAIVGHVNDIQSKSFFGDASAPLQCGGCMCEKGTEFQPHIHKVRERIPRHKTQEFLYIIQGALEATIYSAKKEPVSTLTLGRGSFLCSYDGGHGFKALKSNTKFIEVKNGPFTSVSADKERF